MLHRSIVRLALVLSALGLGACASASQPAVVQQPASMRGHHVPALPTLGSAGPTPSAVATVRDRLYVRTGDGSTEDRIMVLQGVDGAREQELPFGIPSPDWSALYAVEAANGRTTVR